MIPHIGLIFTLATALVLQLILQLVNPQILRYFVDSAIDTSPTAPSLNAVMLAATSFLIVAIATQVTAVLTAYLGSKISWNATNALREDLASHCLELDLSFHKQKTPGDFIQRIDGDVAVLGGFFSTFLITIVGNVVLMISVLTVLSTENMFVGLALCLSSLVMISMMYGMRSLGVPSNLSLYQAYSNFYGFLEERLSGKEDVRALGAIDYVLLRFFQQVRDVFHKTWISGYMNNIIGWTMRFSLSLNHAIAAGLGSYLFLKGEVTLGTVFMIIQYINVLQGPLMSITKQVESLQRFRAAVQRVEELFESKSTIVDGSGTDLPDGPFSVSFDNVSFSYDSDKPILENVTFTVGLGEVLGVVGKTGSGKTTLSRLLFRFYNPDDGYISIDNRPIEDYKVINIRRRISLVTQDVQLFNASIRDNLTFFDKQIDDLALKESIENVGLSSWLKTLPNGLDTRIGNDQFGLSAGQSQLLALARIFLSNPGLVILDEASSRLDPATEDLIEKAIDKLLTNRTAIVIAHRSVTINKADKIIVMDDGRIAESGSRQDLQNNPDSRFYQLLHQELPANEQQ